MNKSRKITIIILSVLIVLTLAFIFSNSLKTQTQSAESSGGLYEKLKPVFDFLFGQGTITHSKFRVMAHFAEFFVFGGEIGLFYHFAFLKPKKRWAEMVSIGLFVAVLDESLQLLNDRGAEVLDVLCDYSGYILAVLIVNCFTYFICRAKKKTDNKTI